MPRLQARIFAHLALFRPPQPRETRRPLPEGVAELHRRDAPFRARPHQRRRRFERQEFDGLADAPDGKVDPAAQFGDGKAVRRAFERLQHLPGFVAGGKRAFDEIVDDPAVLFAAEQNPPGVFDPPAGAPDLLVIGHRRPGRLIVDDEAEVGLVETHAERGRGHERLDAVFDQRPLQRLAPLSRLPRVGSDLQSPRPQPFGHPDGVADRQRIDDPAAGQPGQPFGEPGHALGLRGQADCLERERRAVEIAAQHRQVRAERRAEIVGHAVVRGRGRRQQAEVRREVADDAFDQAIVGPEIVPPVGDAMRFVHHQKGDAPGDPGQNFGVEAFVPQAFG